MPSPFVFCVHVGVEGVIFLVNLREREGVYAFSFRERKQGRGREGVFV